MTAERQKLIDKFQQWLDTNRRKELIASECANITEAYHKHRVEAISDEYDSESGDYENGWNDALNKLLKQ